MWWTVEMCLLRSSELWLTDDFVHCRHISGIGDKMAKKIVEHRRSNGPFICRAQLLSITGLGPKTFEQSAGFLRIMPRHVTDPSERFVLDFVFRPLCRLSVSAFVSNRISVDVTTLGHVHSLRSWSGLFPYFLFWTYIIYQTTSEHSSKMVL